MNKRTLITISGALLALGVQAAVISPDQALQRVSNSKDGKMRAKAMAQPRLAFTQNTPGGEAAVYVYNNAGGGIMLLAADDAAIPMLGYTDSGSFDAANIPPQLQYWLGQYADEIAYAREAGIKPQTDELTLSFPSSWQPVTPMLTTFWDQNAPFNNLTPEISGRHAPTGCVATAMAQVMNYWQYPEKGQGENTFTTTYCGTLSMNFGREAPFDWANMLNSYTTGKYNDTEAQAVAQLMKVCGYSVNMNYRPEASGTQGELVGKALKEYFNYSTGITVESRIGYTATDWNNLVYSQLSVGPIVYTGSSPEGGHCFVVDGYDGDGYFHVNWGWGGSCNGYYTLNALNPAVQGTGGSYGGYNVGQAIVAGVQPDNAPPATNTPVTLSLDGNVTAQVINRAVNMKVTGYTLSALRNETMFTLTPSFGMKITNADGSGTPRYINCTSPMGGMTNMQPGAYLPTDEPGKNITFRASLPTDLEDGEYRIALVCRPYDGAEYRDLIVAPGNFDYVIVKKYGSSFGVTNMSQERFTISNAEITTPLYYSNPYLMEITVVNNSNDELTQFIVPQLVRDNTVMFSGENQLVSVGPKETTKITVSSTFKSQTGAVLPQVGKPVDYTLQIIDLSTGKSYGTYGTVSMNRSSTSMNITSRKLDITNAVADESGMEEGVGYVYRIDRPDFICISQTVEVRGGFIATPITAIISEYDPEEGTAGAQVYEKEFEDMLYLSTGTATLTTTLHFNEFNAGKMYQLSVYCIKNSQRQLLSSLRFAAGSGVDEISGDAEISLVEVYDTNGRMVVAGESMPDFSALSKGIYIVRTVDTAGRVTTVKIAR